jgi:hypothetical protein
MKTKQAENVRATGEALSEQTSGAPDAGAAAGSNPKAPDTARERSAQTKAFSERLNDMTRRAVDEFIAGLGLVDRTTGEPVATREQFDAMTEEEKTALTAQLDELRRSVGQMRLQEQDATLLADPVRGDAYRAVRDKVLALATEDVSLDVEEAFSEVLCRECSQIFREIEKQAQDRAVRSMTETAHAAVGKLGGGDVPVRLHYATMPDEDFERQLVLARSGFLRAR